YRRGLEMLADKPWLGVGPGQATILLPPSFGVPDVIHNDVLNRFAENGLLGGATLLVFLAALLVEGRRGLASLRATDSAASSMAAGWMLSVLFVVVDMQLYPHFYEPANWLAFGVVGGIAAQTRGDFSRRSAADSARPTADSRFRR
ncbi:MAG: hypothetical protein ACR2PL_16250, partial [Dehalococcoidia bacterium]